MQATSPGVSLCKREWIISNGHHAGIVKYIALHPRKAALLLPHTHLPLPRWHQRHSAAAAAAAGEDGASATVLAQAVVAPTNFLSAGLTYVEQAGEGKGVTIGGTVLGGTSSLPTTLVGGARADAESGSTTVAPPALAATAALRLGSLAALHGWATGDYEMLKATVEGQGWKEGVQGIKVGEED